MVVVAFVLFLYLKRGYFYVVLATKTWDKDEQRAWRLYHRGWKAGLEPKYKVMLGNLFSQRGNASEAVEVFDSVIKRGKLLKLKEPQLLANAKISKSMALWVLNEREAAISLLQELYGEGWLDKNLAVNLGSYLLEEGRLKEAKVVLKETSNALTESAGMLDNRGYYLYLTKAYHEAQRLYDALIIDEEPNFPEAYYHAALVKIALAKHRTAVVLLRRALACPIHKTSTVSAEQINDLLEKQRPLVDSDVGEHEFLEDVLERALYEEEVSDEDEETVEAADEGEGSVDIEIDFDEDYHDDSDGVSSVEIENFSPLESRLFDDEYDGDESE